MSVDTSRPHRYPANAPAEVIAWECAACSQWVSEYRYDERGECPVDWRREAGA